MNTKLLRKLIVIGLWLLSIGAAHAEGGTCPPGFYPSNGPGVNGCNPIPGYGQKASQPPPPQWERRWGAIADDRAKGILGAVTDMKSKREAEQAALADCAAKGGSTCRLQGVYDNECIAMALGSKSLAFDVGATKYAAEKQAAEVCSANGAPGCHVYYSACSLPVQIR